MEHAPGVGEQWQHAVAVLDGGARREDAEGNGPGGEEGHEDQVGPRRGDDAHEGRREKHEPAVFGHQGFEVEKVLHHGDGGEGAEGPEEDARHVLADHVVPEVLVEKMIGDNTYADKSEENNVYRYGTETR